MCLASLIRSRALLAPCESSHRSHTLSRRAGGPSKRRKVAHADGATDDDDEDVDELDELSPVENDPDDETFDGPRQATRQKATRRTASKKRSGNDDGDDDTGGGRRTKRAAGGDLLTGEYKIASDNTLFEAVRKSGSALESTVEDWVHHYQGGDGDGDDADVGRGEALAELINFLLRVRPGLQADVSSLL